MEDSPTEKLSAQSGSKAIPSSSSSKRKSLNDGKGNKKKSTTMRKTSLKRKKEAISQAINSNSGDDSGDEYKYKVEAIVDKQVVGGVVQYFVKWEGWESESNTWEPIKHLKYCQEKIDAYENQLEASRQGVKTSSKIRKSGRGSSCSVAPNSKIVASPSLKKTSTSSAKSKSKTQERNCNLTRNQAVVEEVLAHDEELSSGVEDDDKHEPTTDFDVLSKYPPGKEIEKIHAVAVVNGYLTFLVQWKTNESPSQEEQQLPPLSEKNSNMVRAMSLNEGFPQDIIRFYEKRIRYFVNMDPVEKEAGKAAQVREKAEERKHAVALKKETSTLTSASVSTAIGEESDMEDAATKAIAKSERKYDIFDPFDSEEMSSSSDELQSSDEDQGIQD